MERSKCQQLEEVEGFGCNGLITQQQPFNHQNPTLLFPKLPIDNDSSLISLDIGGNNLLYLLVFEMLFLIARFPVLFSKLLKFLAVFLSTGFCF